MLDKDPDGSVGDNIHRQIRNDIIFGRLLPGQKLRLEPMRQAYGISVATLREILNRLTAVGLVTAEGQKGFSVAPASCSDLKEIAELRSLLETKALQDSLNHGDLNWEASVVAAHYKLASVEAKVLAQRDEIPADLKENWKRFDWEFHRALIQACPSRNLLSMHAVIFGKFLRYQLQVQSIRGETAVEEHRHLLEAAKARDTEWALEVLNRHIHGSAAHLTPPGGTQTAR
ncbi:GntR family transcriptional regulator [Roseibium litorale]|uniref:GntR family transcriptional regulator n=1 Tax=Roseibium litorale TaxID=2803841 RepID=A0ABR9CU36_9HYPH|nr:GntR family transcriptional regulator [Roseibium litorale]MBD8893920.1 GntR family transcriptional regulator [Roseibium litorale]